MQRVKAKHAAIAALVWAMVLLFPLQATAAGPVYRSVDESGAVTYSDEPPAGAIEIKPLVLPPPPSEEDQAMVSERMKAAAKLADEIAEERKQRQKEEEEARARRKLRQMAVTDMEEEPEKEGEVIYRPVFLGWPSMNYGYPHPGYGHRRSLYNRPFPRESRNRRNCRPAITRHKSQGVSSPQALQRHRPLTIRKLRPDPYDCRQWP